MVILYGQGEFEGIDDALFRERNKYAYNPQRVDIALTERGGWGSKWGDPRPFYGNPDDLQEHKLRRLWKPAAGEMYATGDVKPYRGFDSVLKDPKTSYFMQANKVRADAGPQWTNYNDFHKKDYPKGLKYKDQRRDWGLLRHQAATVAQNRGLDQLYGGQGPAGAYYNPPDYSKAQMTYSPHALPPRAYQETQRMQRDAGPGALVPYTGASNFNSFDDAFGGYGYGGGYDAFGYGGYPTPFGAVGPAAASYAPAYGMGGYGMASYGFM